MKIDCPVCSSRPLNEFVYHGDVSARRPADDSSRESWVDYLYFRDNPKGWLREYWRHQGGCGAWLALERHTVSHRIRSVKLLRGAADD